MSDEILLELFDEDLDPAEAERMALSLRRELLEIDEVEDVAAATAGPAPPGARGVELASLGALVVAAQPTMAVLGKVLGLLRSWLKPGGATMRVTVNGQSIELTPSKEQQDALVAGFLAQVAARPAGGTAGPA
jgi:hypothetical protein